MRHYNAKYNSKMLSAQCQQFVQPSTL